MSSSGFLLCLVIFFSAQSAASAAKSLEIRTNHGAILGTERDGAGFFPNIAFAPAPLGGARWSPSTALSQHSQRVESVACPQMSGDGMPGPLLATSEDCLYLNVWAPPAAKSAPIILFVHGGGGVSGSGLRSFYDGALFARNGVMFVSFNYRLGLLGMLSAKGEHSPAISDMMAALEWVRAHAEHFGGDPSRITLMGHSRGADMVRALFDAALNGPATKAIILSHSTRDAVSANTSPNSQDPGTIEKLRSLSAEEILATQNDLLISFRMPKVAESRWQNASLLMTAIANEKLNTKHAAASGAPAGLYFYCPLARMAREARKIQRAYFYFLYPSSRKHGGELEALFAQDEFGKSFLRHLVAFASEGELPVTFLQKLSSLFVRAPRALHLRASGSWYQPFDISAKACQ